MQHMHTSGACAVRCHTFICINVQNSVARHFMRLFGDSLK